MEWKPVVGYEGYYEVSNTGLVRSVNRIVEKSNGVQQTRYGKIKKQWENPDGYLTVKLSKDGEDRRYPVHVIVATAFISADGDGLEINHKDYDRKNNNVNNLEWISHKDNIRHTLDGGRHITQIRDMSGRNNPNYGNRKLSQKYKNDKEYAKEKQSRKGVSNGRATPIEMIDRNGNIISFPYITKCAEYLIEHGYTKAKNVYNVAGVIGQCVRKNTMRYEHSFRKQSEYTETTPCQAALATELKV